MFHVAKIIIMNEYLGYQVKIKAHRQAISCAVSGSCGTRIAERVHVSQYASMRRVVSGSCGTCIAERAYLLKHERLASWPVVVHHAAGVPQAIAGSQRHSILGDRCESKQACCSFCLTCCSQPTLPFGVWYRYNVSTCTSTDSYQCARWWTVAGLPW